MTKEQLKVLAGLIRNETADRANTAERVGKMFYELALTAPPEGGASGYILSKKSENDYDYEWVEMTSSPSGDFANIDASNIDEHISDWREKLGIEDSSLANEWLKIGNIQVDDNDVIINLDDSGENRWRINNVEYFKNTSTTLPIAPVVEFLRTDVIVGNTDNTFEIIEGVESESPDTPIITNPNQLFLTTVLVTPDGLFTEQPPIDLSGYRLKSIDGWVNWNFSGNPPAESYAVVSGLKMMKYRLRGTVNSSINLAGIRTSISEILYSGVTATFKNETNFPVNLISGTSSNSTDTKIKSSDLPYSIGVGESVDISYDRQTQTWDVLKRGGEGENINRHITFTLADIGATGEETKEELNNLVATYINSLGIVQEGEDNYYFELIQEVWGDEGGADLPVGNEDDVLVYEGGQWVGSNRLALEEAKTDSVTNLMLHYWDSSVSKWISSGLQFISGTINRLKFTGNIEADALIFPNNSSTAIANRLRNLNNRLKFANSSAIESDIAFVSDINSTNVTSAINSATTDQKTTMRVALLGTAVPASPVINTANTYFIKKETDSIIFLTGVNLTPLDPTLIWLETSDGTKVFANNYYAMSGATLQTFWNIPASFPSGIYDVKISFGAVTQGASPAKMEVVEETDSIRIPLTSSNVIVKVRDGYTQIANTSRLVSEDVLKTYRVNTSFAGNDNSIDAVIKTDNILLGDKSWEILLDISIEQYSGADGALTNFIGITETSNTALGASISNLINNYVLYNSTAYRIRNSTGMIVSDNASCYLVIRKSGNTLISYRFNSTTGVVDAYVSMNLDTSKNYALYISEFTTNRNPSIRRIMTSISVK